MDANPWTYQVMAKELMREGKLEPVPSRPRPSVRPAQLPVRRGRQGHELPVAAGVRHVGRHGAGGQAARRRPLVHVASRRAGLVDPARRPGRDDGRAAAGLDERDVEAIKAVAVPVAKTGDPPAPAPADYIHVRRLNRGFLLDDVPAAAVVPAVERRRDAHPAQPGYAPGGRAVARSPTVPARAARPAPLPSGLRGGRKSARSTRTIRTTRARSIAGEQRDTSPSRRRASSQRRP